MSARVRPATRLPSATRVPTMRTLPVAKLWISVAPVSLPVRFEMDEENVTVATLTTRKVKPWSRFRRAAADHRGAILSPFDHRSRLDRFHGMNLRYDQKDRERVLEYLKSRLPVDIANG